MPAYALDDLTRSFAYCAGRYSAEMEHAWLLDSEHASEKEARRGAFVSLLDAIVAPGEGADVLHHRISAKVAQAALLSRAAFAEEAATREASAKMAEAHLRICRRFLLQG